MSIPDWEKRLTEAKAALQSASTEIWRLLKINERLRAQIKRLGHTPDDAEDGQKEEGEEQ